VNPNLEGAVWRRSSRSGGNGGACVELAHGRGVIGVRDSKDVSAGPLVFERAAAAAFLSAVRSGRFDG
jgi:hypothetical protein